VTGAEKNESCGVLSEGVGASFHRPASRKDAIAGDCPEPASTITVALVMATTLTAPADAMALAEVAASVYAVKLEW